MSKSKKFRTTELTGFNMSRVYKGAEAKFWKNIWTNESKMDQQVIQLLGCWLVIIIIIIIIIIRYWCPLS